MSDKVNFGAAERQGESARAGRCPGAEGGLGRIKERLDKVRALIQEPEFLEGKGLSSWISYMEEADGRDYLLEQLNSAIGNGEFIEKIQYEPHEPGDVLMLTGVGEVFPFMRIHTLLEDLYSYFSDVPILVMYPGEFDGRHVKLFNRLKPNDYYRAFNVIE